MFGNKLIKAFAEAVSPSITIRDSFDSFIQQQLPNLINTLRPIECVVYTSVGVKSVKLTVLSHKLLAPLVVEPDSTTRPCMPHECRLRNLTYSGPLYVQMKCEIEWNNQKMEHVLNDVYVGRVPIMIYSSLCHVNARAENKECEYDVGGYFIISGKEKVLITQTGGLTNRMVCYKSKKNCAVAVQSEKDYRMYVTTIKYTNSKKPITITFPRLQDEVPVMTLLVALGFSIDEIKSVYTAKELILLHGSFNSLPTDQAEARRRIVIREVYNLGEDPEARLKNAFDNMLVPHIENDYSIKGCFLLKMVRELLKVATGERKATDRDSLVNQRMHSSYSLLSTLFYQLLITWSDNLKKNFNKLIAKRKLPLNVATITRVINENNCITDGFSYALATGTFNTKSVNKKLMKGVSQQFQRQSYVAGLSHLRKVSSSIDAEMNKNPLPRYLHGTQYGRLCPAESPEGATVGLEKTLAVTAYISLETSPSPILHVITPFLLPVCVGNIQRGCDVYVNGVYVGITMLHTNVVQTVKAGRRSGQFEKDVSISLIDDIVHISTTAGRVCRPLLIVEDGAVLYDAEHDMGWHELMKRGYVEYLDAEEEQTCYVSHYPETVTKEHTHCEIANTAINGINAGTIPFSNHNPAPRNCFQSAMGKQAQGTYATNYQHRVDTTSNVLYYSQKPLVDTQIGKVYNVHKCAHGTNAIVAIMPFQGYGQEDSVIFNQAFIDRGGFRADHYTVVEESAVKNTKEKTTFGVPTKKRKVGCYDKLDQDGIILPGAAVAQKDCLVGKRFERNANFTEDQSVLSDKKGIVDKVYLFQDKKGNRGTKIKLRTRQIPKIGDKLSSRHGQKGTCGMIYPPEDLPFTLDGIKPDIIVNPHAIPSRMTIAHLMETLVRIRFLFFLNSTTNTPTIDRKGNRSQRRVHRRLALHGPHRERHMQTPPQGRLPEGRERNDAVGDHGRDAPLQDIHRSHILPTPQAHGRLQVVRKEAGEKERADEAAQPRP